MPKIFTTLDPSLLCTEAAGLSEEPHEWTITTADKNTGTEDMTYGKSI